jgi:hypothetical protein
MSIFTRSAPAQQTKAAPPPQASAEKAQAHNPSEFAPRAAAATQPAAPGVVPPAAAPIYSMRPAEPAQRVEAAAKTALAERTTVTADAQVKTRVDVERARVVAQATRSTASPTQSAQRRTEQQSPRLAAPATPVTARHGFDPSRAAQAGLLNLAWRWQEAGSPIRAIHAYMELLCRYPDSASADAAIADLVALSDKLTEQGQFHTALAIYDQLEELLA